MHPLNVPLYTLFFIPGNSAFVKDLHPLKQSPSKYSQLKKLNDVSPEQPSNAYCPTLFT